MATTAKIISDRTNSAGRTISWICITDDGRIFAYGPKPISTSGNAQAEANASITDVESTAKQQDYEKCLEDCFAGLNVDDQHVAGAYPFLIRNDVRRKCLRRIAHRLEDLNRTAIEELVNCSVWVHTLTDQNIANRLEGSWTAIKVNNKFKGRLNDLVTCVNALTHGETTPDEDE